MPSVGPRRWAGGASPDRAPAAPFSPNSRAYNAGATVAERAVLSAPAVPPVPPALHLVGEATGEPDPADLPDGPIVKNSMVDLLPGPGLGLDIDAKAAKPYLKEEDSGFFDP